MAFTLYTQLLGNVANQEVMTVSPAIAFCCAIMVFIITNIMVIVL